ncbi:hypothetical protein KM911_08840 [Bacillus paralicheniformis]|uniref:hypothetical protein n=1 Tax=Bacillus TaxID=1386 RepID=UPI001C21F5F1|nr:hypothetical protein [Bacillus paralicheniformis]MBU8581812.1 hypothetical protein [Bacillus paralicheniformis]
MMITVKIRHTAETEGTDIGDFTPAELESIVQTIRKYGAWLSPDADADDYKFTFRDAKYNLEQRVFEIIVE